MDNVWKNRQHQWKERLKISKTAKFESVLLKTYKDIAPQSREILQTFLWWGVELAPHHTNVEHRSRNTDAIIGWLQTRHILLVLFE